MHPSIVKTKAPKPHRRNVADRIIAHRRAIYGVTWIIYMFFTIVFHPIAGKSVMVPSVFLCGLAVWLYNPGMGFFTMLLTHPWHFIMLMYVQNDFDAWRIALEPGGFIAQLFLILLSTKLKSNRQKIRAINEGLEQTIAQRNEELATLSQYLENTSSSARSRLSTTLCQDVGANLLGMQEYCEQVHRDLKQKDLAEVAEAETLVRLARKSVEDVNQIIQKLSLKQEEQADLKEAILELTSYFNESTGADFKVRISHRYTELPSPVARHLSRIAHEAVTNALRHANASDIHIHLKIDDQTCWLTVENNGRPISTAPHPGMGIRMIKHRAQALNGTIHYDTTEDRRTRFNCQIPKPPPPQKAFHRA